MKKQRGNEEFEDYAHVYRNPNPEEGIDRRYKTDEEPKELNFDDEGA